MHARCGLSLVPAWSRAAILKAMERLPECSAAICLARADGLELKAEKATAPWAREVAAEEIDQAV
jgi:hypothetical protein